MRIGDVGLLSMPGRAPTAARNRCFTRQLFRCHIAVQRTPANDSTDTLRHANVANASSAVEET